MKTLSASVALCSLLLCGCETGYLRQIDILDRPSGPVAHAKNLDESLVAVLNLYASDNGLTCDSESTLPVRCRKAPIQVFAFKTVDGATVCYGALGVPLENSRHETRTKQLESALTASFGKNNVASGRLVHSWPEKCELGAQATFAAKSPQPN